MIGNVLVASLLIGVARSWELVGDRDTGISASIAALTGHERHFGGPWPARPMSCGMMRRPRRRRQPRHRRQPRRGTLLRQGKPPPALEAGPPAARTGMTGPGVSGIRK